MPFEPKEWENLPSRDTPINAESLKDLEKRITDYTDQLSFGSGSYYRHQQSIASSVWTINHNLARIPSVTIINSAGEEEEGDVQHTDVNNTILTFGAAFSGEAYLN